MRIAFAVGFRNLELCCSKLLSRITFGRLGIQQQRQLHELIEHLSKEAIEEGSLVQFEVSNRTFEGHIQLYMQLETVCYYP